VRNKYLLLFSSSLAFILACSILTSPPNTAEPTPTVVTSIAIPYAKIIYYDVGGSTESEIRDQLNVSAPVGKDGFRGDALTTWDIRWTWDGYGNDSCDLNSVKVTYDIRVQFPRWTPSADVSQKLRTKWNSYIAALTAHEKGHVDNVVANFPNVVNAIRRGTCSTADARAQDILTAIRQNDLDYDARTNHGATQGAIFP
jgi:predicted secreted Zn-dependent protease